MRNKEKETAKYNERMKERLFKSNQKGSSGRTKKVYAKEPQIRKPSTKVNKGESFTKSKPWTSKIPVQLYKAVPAGYRNFDDGIRRPS